MDATAVLDNPYGIDAEAMGRSNKLRCRLPDGGPSSGFTGATSHLLRTRLRVAVLIILTGFALHVVRNLLLSGPTLDHFTLRLSIAVCEIVVLLIVSAVLWSSWTVSRRGLRVLELTVFGMIAVFFAWLQFEAYHDRALMNSVVQGREALVFKDVGMAAALRWFLLIVLYGAFIPNTWQRCAAVTGALAAIPLALAVGDSLVESAVRPYILTSFPEMVILLGTAVAIAVFGSHHIRELQQKAHEAERIGQYRLKEVIGFGGMGTVYLAEHVLLRRPCAIKLICPEHAGDPRTLARFEREVRATATLTHPNTIEIFDYGRAEDGTFYYVMEYLPGMNLQDLVDEYGPMPAARAVYLLRQVCQALREAHSIGLIHRDIKPSNVLACERGKMYDVAKLIDFGLVKSLDLSGDPKMTRDGSFTGSPTFMSPEQAAGRPQIDARSDIYNVGAVAYFLITGQRLFDRESILQLMHAHAYEPVVFAPEFDKAVPSDLRAVVLRCLDKDPDRRYQDAASLDKALAVCACARQWSAERAEEWWAQHCDKIIPVCSSETVDSERGVPVAG